MSQSRLREAPKPPHWSQGSRSLAAVEVHRDEFLDKVFLMLSFAVFLFLQVAHVEKSAKTIRNTVFHWGD